MNKPLKIAVILSTALVGGCVNLHDLRQKSPKGEDFANQLASMYLAYSEEELDRFDMGDSERFARKGLLTLQGQSIPLEETGDLKISSGLKSEIDKQRALVVSFNNEANRKNNPKALARAIVSFDCYTDLLNDNPGSKRLYECRRDLRDSLAFLESGQSAPAAKSNEFITTRNPMSTTSETSVSRKFSEPVSGIVDFISKLLSKPSAPESKPEQQNNK